MEQLTEINSLVIKQQKELTEILTGFETRNKYQVMNEDMDLLFMAHETGGNWLTRTFLNTLRPFVIDIRGMSGNHICTITRPFRFYFHEIQIIDSHDRVIGTVKREFSILRRVYTVFDGDGNKIFELFGPLLKPWTFEIRACERKVGEIAKKWSGLLTEGFTDADTFGVQFPQGWKDETKATILGAVFLIDFVHFEKSDKS